ncbi:SMP-30/gluconolactonase/LRE family protein [Aurantiacibacter hainanensis]|uniref:SMP-30/gluconolactonase/LRE family protein n=1 Tax=Aurantiacibacter hainanensis TaxID=3076114 RepID=UPI0030C6F84D
MTVPAQVIAPAASAEWRPVDATTGQIEDLTGLEQLAEDFPNSASVRLRLLNAYVVAEQAGAALAVAENLVAQGYAFSPGAVEFLQGLVETGGTPAWLSTSGQNAAPVAASHVAATIPAEALLPEGVAVLGDDRFAVTTVVSREVWMSDDAGWEASTFPDAANLSGIAADTSGMIIASGDLGMVAEGEEVFAGLIALENDSRPVRIAAPEGVQLSDMAFFRDQTVYASDPLGGGVYRSDGMGEGLEALVPLGTLRSPQGIAPSEDGSRLYVSDYRYGLAMIDTATGAVSRLAADIPVLLDGIDGLWLHVGELVAIQNGLSPMRIIALRLSADGTRITAMRVLERANPDWTEPLGGDIHEGALFYIGNGSWDLFEEGGKPKDGAELRATHIRRLELAENPAN